MQFQDLLSSIGICVGAAALIALLGYRLKQPLILAYLLAGVLIGPVGLNLVQDRESIQTVAEIGRRMGMTRQGVQRVADLLVEQGLAEYRPNPAHRRAKLLACTEAGYWAIRKIALVQRPWADRIAAEIGTEALHQALATTRALTQRLEAEA